MASNQLSGSLDLLYPALHRMEGDGLLSSRWDTASGRRRRAYSLTQAGREALAQRRREWRTFSRGVQAVIGPATAVAP
jgi:PadR family transcriptional regulator